MRKRVGLYTAGNPVSLLRESSGEFRWENDGRTGFELFEQRESFEDDSASIFVPLLTQSHRSQYLYT